MAAKENAADTCSRGVEAEAQISITNPVRPTPWNISRVCRTADASKSATRQDQRLTEKAAGAAAAAVSTADSISDAMVRTWMDIAAGSGHDNDAAASDANIAAALGAPCTAWDVNDTTSRVADSSRTYLSARPGHAK
jgi:hypothetical protein